jgi:putative phosphoesterase
VTERLALLGDIHGNFAALSAVLEEVRRAGISAGVCTGDVVLRGTEPEACVATVRALGWPWVAGNTDRKIVAREPRPLDHPASRRLGSRSWTHNHLSDASLRHLADLPSEARVRFAGSQVVVLHGGSAGGTPLVADTTPDDDLLHLARDLGADCIVSGHTHRPLVRTVGPCLFVNPGSVGEGEGDDHRPAWAWLGATSNGLQATLERVPLPLAPPRAQP